MSSRCSASRPIRYGASISVWPSAADEPTQWVTYSPRSPFSVMIATAYFVTRVFAPFMYPNAPTPPPPFDPRFSASK